jgi:hypothetical protein
VKEIQRLWSGRPELRRRYLQQVRRMRKALLGSTASYPGFKPSYRPDLPSYYPEKYVEGGAHISWAIGYHAGRAFRLREEAYDSRPMWGRVGSLAYLKPHYHARLD